jgi:spore coat protein CotH
MGNYVRAVRGNAYGANDFEDNGDGTVTDHATGLMWAKADSGEGMDWPAALAYAEDSTLAGYDDWRLPNVKELQSIVSYTHSPSASDAADLGPAIDTDYFEITELPAGTTNYETDYGYFWSSTSAYFGGNSLEYYYAWYVAFGTAVSNAGNDSHGAGAVRFDTKVEGGPLGEGGERYYNYVRLVRGGNVEQSAGDDPGATNSTDTTDDQGDTSDPAGDAPDLAAAAAILGVTEAELQEALGDPAEAQPDLAAAAAQLGVTEQELMDALAASTADADNADDTDDADGTADSADSGTLVINEIVAKDADGGNDWIELYVTEGTVALGDYTIVDDDTDHEAQELPDVSLSAGEFYIIEAIDEDDECPDGSSCVPFKLGSDDAVTLYYDGVQVDILDWAEGEAGEGYSFGLLPDGTGTAQTLSPTKGAANEAIDDSDDVDTDATVDFFSEDTVENVYITISETDWNSILASPLLEEYHTASITYRDVTLDNVAFRTKGSSSLQAVANMNSTRYSFKVDMNYYVDGQKLLGMKKINLNNNYKDPSYMRERISYDMMRFLDLPTTRLSYVNLYINGSLHGLYTLVEQVDSEFLEENFENPEGDLYKPDGTGSDLLWLGADFTAYSGVELKTNEESSDNSAFINMVNELNNGSDLASVIDVDEVLRYLAVSTALSNLDSYQGSLAHNYYLYEQDGVFSIIPWDFNESFGTFRMDCQDGSTMISLYIDEPTSGALADRPLIAKLLEYETYKTAYHGYIQDLMDGIMDPDVVSNTIEETKNLISAHVYNDPTAFYSYAEFEASLGDGMVGDIFGLQGFVDERTENMAGQLSGSEPIEGDGSGSCSGGFMPVPQPGGGGMPR